MYALRARVQNYAWGKVGHASAVAQLKVSCQHAGGCQAFSSCCCPQALQPGSTVDPEKPYAEYWYVLEGVACTVRAQCVHSARA